MNTTISGANSLSQLMGRKGASLLYYASLTMNPFWLYGIEPWALGWKRTGDDAYSFARLLDLAVVFSYPLTNHLADVPGSIILNKEQGLFPLFLQSLAAPGKKLYRDITDGTTIYKAKKYLFLKAINTGSIATKEQSVAGQSFRIRIIFLWRLLNESHCGLLFVYFKSFILNDLSKEGDILREILVFR